MADRRVTHTGKDRDGDIVSLCNPGAVWLRRPKAGAISDIENRVHTYHVQLQGGSRAEIGVANGPNGKYLRSDWDSTTKNNLDDLPDC